MKKAFEISKKIFLIITFLFAQFIVKAQSTREENTQNEKAIIEKIIAWKNNVKKSSFNDGNALIISFPEEDISKKIWETFILQEVKSSNVTMRTVLALLIGNKKLYPDTSIKILVKLLRDSADIVAINAIYSLASFG